MGMNWTDIREIAVALDEAHPEANPRFLNFLDLRTWILGLEGFEDAPPHSGEKVLEAIQLAWIEERE
jgi:FeS assembly protein IscX